MVLAEGMSEVAIRIPTGPCSLAFMRERGQHAVVLATNDAEEGASKNVELTLAPVGDE